MLDALIEPEIKHSSQIIDNNPVNREPWWKKIRSINYRKNTRDFFSKKTVVTMQNDGKVFLSLLSFLGLVIIFLVDFCLKIILSIGNVGKLFSGRFHFWESRLGKATEGLVNVLETREGVKRSFLIGLAFRNMRVKKMRSVVTVGGVSLGIGAIVFLVSLGYGVQRLVVGRVARLDDLRMADVLLGKSSLLKLDTEALQRISQLDKVEKILPVVSLVGKTDYKGSISEVVAYAVPDEYLKLANVLITKGQGFKSNTSMEKRVIPRVAGATTEWKFEQSEFGTSIRKVNFNILEGEWMKVREEPRTDSKILGYAKRFEGGYDGIEVWGGTFVTMGREGKMARDNRGNYLGKWVKAPFLMYEVQGEDFVPMKDNGLLDWREGYVAEIADIVTIDEQIVAKVDGEVLGDSTPSGEVVQEAIADVASISAKVVGTDASGVEWVELDEGTKIENQTLTIPFASNAIKLAVVNKAFLEATGIDPDKAIGEKFKMSLLISKAIKSDLDRQARSEEAEFKISGIFDGGTSPTMYLPFSDVQGLGINNFSQAKLVVNNKGDLQRIRDQIDGLGYKTSSVADTVAQIDSMFSTIRLVLASFGLVALAVASLGMFNTMTVSLMERTHEVGVMKAMGMRSEEVKELFLAEAMVMGIMGGLFGVGFGVMAGNLLGALLSIFSLSKGIGWISVSYFPMPFVIFILVLSFLVGVMTGIYPAKRATKISALDALRYE